MTLHVRRQHPEKLNEFFESRKKIYTAQKLLRRKERELSDTLSKNDSNINIDSDNDNYNIFKSF